MKTQWVFKQCDKQKNQAKEYWSGKVPRLERLLSTYSHDVRRLRLSLRHHEKRHDWELRCVLHLPTGTLVAEETCETLFEAIDAVVDELATQIQRHKGRIRKDRLARRRSLRRERLMEAEPLLVLDAAADRGDSFLQLLLPHMDQLYDLAKSELAIMEIEERVPKGEWTAHDLVDDVLLRGCKRFDQRRATMPIDAWLVELLNERTEELCEHAIKPVTLATVEFDYEEDERDGDLDDLQFWLRKFVNPVEPLALEDLVPDEDGGDMWQRLSADEQQARLSEVLGAMRKRQRQALMLTEVYGFDIQEAAMSLDCEVEDLLADIETGREKIRLALSAIV